MKQAIAMGIQNFEKLRNNNCFYVDKTEFIREWWNNGADATLLTRPRRFGKTLNLSMLECFFSIKFAGRGELFEGLKIWKDESFRKLQGTYPVIFLTFADVKQETFEESRETINQLIEDQYIRYHWMLEEKWFTEKDHQFFRKVSSRMSNATAAVSIRKLCEWLSRHYGKKVIVLLDEYDTPLQEAYLQGYWDEMAGYIRTLFNSTFKSNDFMERGLMTGITRVSKESIFSDLNNLDMVTTTSNKYATCFGFTEEEVFQALDNQGFAERDKQDVKIWYDGFTFGCETDMYNPWSITNYLDKKQLKPYWANSSGNALVGKLIREGDQTLKMNFEELLRGGNLIVPIDEEIVFSQLDESQDAIWSLLLASGYLKVVRPLLFREEEYVYGKPLYTLALTNREVTYMFRGMIQNWFGKGGGLTTLTKALLRGEEEDATELLTDILETSMSSFDPGGIGENKVAESFYHGLVLGLLVESGAQYQIKSNRESGLGRYDVVLDPIDPNGTAMILEFKVFKEKRGEKTLEDTCRNALKQIEEKKYDTDLLARGIPPERILKYGLAFRGKECLVQKAERNASPGMRRLS